MVEKFYTRFRSEISAGVDAFMENCGNCYGYLVPQISQISEVILHMKKCKAFDVIVLPYWESAPFWPLISEKRQISIMCARFAYRETVLYSV